MMKFVKLLPVMFGVVSISLIYLLAGEKNLAFFLLFLAINPYHIYYSQEFRSYSMLAMLGIFLCT